MNIFTHYLNIICTHWRKVQIEMQFVNFDLADVKVYKSVIGQVT